MRNTAITILLFWGNLTFAQAPISKIDSANWQSVKVCEFRSLRWSDTLEICGGEWFVDGAARSIAELDRETLLIIKKTVAKYGCPIAFVDVKNYVTSHVRGKLYVVGIKHRE